MSWAKLSDTFPSHPKAVAAGDLACWLYVAGLCWAKHHQTDGAIPSGIVSRLVASRKANSLAQVLVRVRLWEETVDGFQIHDYADENLTRAELEESRNGARNRQQRRRFSRLSRCDNSVALSENDAVTNAVVTGLSRCDSRARARPQPRSESESESDKDPESVVAVRDDPSRVSSETPRPKRKPPMPYSVAEAIAEVASAAGERFVAGDHVTRGVAMGVTNVIRRGVALADFRLLGEWLAAGGAAWMRDPPGPSWLASGRFGEDLARARQWAASGRARVSVASSPQSLPAAPVEAFVTEEEVPF